jgi:hypothetical protein
MNPFSIVKDSSIWQTQAAYEGISRKDPYLRIGIVKRAYKDESTSDVRYLVEIQDRNKSIEVNARYLRSFGGVFNYEDVIYRGYKIDQKPDPVRAFEAKAGDAVLVGFLNGEPREAIILGSLMHPARSSDIDPKKGPQFKSEFNGIETHINELGEYKLTFKAQPKNLKKLEEVPRSKLPKPEYDDKVGGSFFQFDKTGSIEINDRHKEGFQNLRIDKPTGTITINSGKIKLTMTKKEEKLELKCKIVNITSDDKININTKEYKLEAQTSVKIKSSKIAIGKDGVELLDQIFQLIEALGKITPISPVGPCTALMAAPQWSKVVETQNKIKEITGSF